MLLKKRALGIYREATNSPHRESDDALILRAVLEELKPLGFAVRVVSPEESDELDLSAEDVVIPMCESYPRIMRLAAAARGMNTAWVNPPDSVLMCYRVKMAPALQAAPGVRFPPTEIRLVEGGPGLPPGFPASGGYWIKRGDVHNTCDRDVVFLPRWSEAAAVLQDFASREITHWLVQPHIEGDLIKFYGAGPGHWFTWFYHDPVRAKRHFFEVDGLASQAALGARALELEIFGGDAIVAQDGAITMLDLNSWPSFALVRREAAVQIAWHLQRRLITRPRTEMAA